MLALALLLAAASPVRVYVAPLTAPNIDAATASLIYERVLAGTARHQAHFIIQSSKEVQTVMEADAAKQAMGCDTESCAAEIADALGAPQLVTGQIGRIGDTWQLSLTRTERATLKAVRRVQVDAQGQTAEVLLPRIDEAVDELFDLAPGVQPNVPLAVGSGIALGVGVLGIAGGAAMVGVSWQQYAVAEAALKDGADDQARAARDFGAPLAPAGWVTLGIGGALAVGGGALLALALVRDWE